MKTKNIIDAIKKAKHYDFISRESQLNINKLFNIKKTAQFELMNLSDENCDEIINALELLEVEIKSTGKRCKNIQKLRPEYIPIILSDNNFI
jgi:dissimilatory sulfite reductase (desulfoviridin) alpha/beta subunit